MGGNPLLGAIRQPYSFDNWVSTNRAEFLALTLRLLGEDQTSRYLKFNSWAKRPDSHRYRLLSLGSCNVFYYSSLSKPQNGSSLV